MKKRLLGLSILALPLLAFAAAPCDSSKESCGGGKKPGLEEILSPAARPAAKTEKIQVKSAEPAEKPADIAGVPEIPAVEKPRAASFENPGYLILWLGIIAALYFYLGGVKKRKKAAK